jgi:hypothetical protein
MHLVFHGLYAFDTRSVCELRVFADANRMVVVATELEDNPGMSVVNAVKSLTSDVGRDFGSMETKLIVHAPNGDAFPPIWTEAPLDDLEWDRTSREQVENMVGTDLPEPVGKEHTMAAVGGDRHPLLGVDRGRGGVPAAGIPTEGSPSGATSVAAQPSALSSPCTL